MTSIRGLCAAMLLAGGAMGTSAPAHAVTYVLDFSGSICGMGGSACVNGSQIGASYGDATGVDVSYASYLGNTTIETFLKYWDGSYGDLSGVVWGGNGPSARSEMTFTALPGYELTLLSFDAACYQNRVSCRTLPYSVTEIGSMVPAAGASLMPPAGGHSDVALSLAYSTAGYVLSWGPDGYDGGLDNITFDVRAAGMGAVPEPATWMSLILGFGLVGGAIRARKTRIAGLSGARTA